MNDSIPSEHQGRENQSIKASRDVPCCKDTVEHTGVGTMVSILDLESQHIGPHIVEVKPGGSSQKKTKNSSKKKRNLFTSA